MRARNTNFFALLLTIAVVSSACAVAQAAPAEKPARAELAVDYTYLHSNAPPGGCGCFNMNGGSATFAWQFVPERFALVGDITADYSGGTAASGYALTLSTYTAGARYLIPVGQSPLRPFGQVLVGVAHASGSLVQGQTPAASNASAAFAANVGGGLDLGLSRHFAVRLIDASYLVTTFDNGVNDHQNNLRLSAGVVFRF